MSDLAETLGDYFRLMAGNGADHVYRAAVEAGLLDALAAKPQAAEALASSRELDAGAVGQVLCVLRVLGLTQEAGGAWSLTPLAEALRGGAYRQLGDPYWSHLPEYLRTGEPIAAMDEAGDGTARYGKDGGQAAALGWMLRPAAAAAAEVLLHGADLDKPLRILDAGAGSAVWSLTLAAHHPRAHVTAVDRPGVVEVAQANAEAMVLADRFIAEAADLATAELPREAFDLALLANVAHLLPPPALAGLCGKLAATLRPGGRLAVIDVFPGPAVGDLNRTLYTLGLSLRTRAGRTHDPAAVAAALGDAGLVDVTHRPIDALPHTLGVVVGGRRSV
ncbi:MAG: class I SAM-dependent methyltransferase [Planctomycetota bacterium]